MGLFVVVLFLTAWSNNTEINSESLECPSTTLILSDVYTAYLESSNDTSTLSCYCL